MRRDAGSTRSHHEEFVAVEVRGCVPDVDLALDLVCELLRVGLLAVTLLYILVFLSPEEGSVRRFAEEKGLLPGEQAVRDAFPTVTILRPSVVFGPEDQFFNRFAAMATVSPVLPLIGGGETRFQPVYVGDVADAVIKCLEDPATARLPATPSFRSRLARSVRPPGLFSPDDPLTGQTEPTELPVGVIECERQRSRGLG